MSTVNRAKLSQKNPYWISEHRYYELKHFCLQYPEWKAHYATLDGLRKNRLDGIYISGTGEVSDPVVRCAEEREYYALRIRMVETAAREADQVVGNYILCGVTTGLSYEKLAARDSVPCCKEVYYKLYRRFFWLLDKLRG